VVGDLGLTLRVNGVTTKHQLLRHFLAALAYRTQKAVRGMPESFAHFSAGNRVRTPQELICHMTSVLGYARAQFGGGTSAIALCATWREEVGRFHAMLKDLSDVLKTGDEPLDASLEAILQGPLSDAMTHAGQLVLLRRLAGHPVQPENFMRAHVDPDNVSADQPPPASPGRRDGSGADPLQ
jgi:hypothetical protein